MVKVILDLEFDLACWYATEVIVDMTVDSVVMSLVQNLLPLGIKYASIALFAGMSISHLRICSNRRHWLSRWLLR